VFVGRWRDMAAVRAHVAEDQSQEIVGVIGALSERSMAVEIHEMGSARVE
jgi:quinol monooxygenase YgiN